MVRRAIATFEREVLGRLEPPDPGLDVAVIG